MPEFKWHLMSEKKPEHGVRPYLLMGPKGGLRIAHGYDDGGTEPHFHDYKNGYGYIDPKHVHAWAEIPPLEVES